MLKSFGTAGTRNRMNGQILTELSLCLGEQHFLESLDIKVLREYQNRVYPAHLIARLSDVLPHKTQKVSEVLITQSPIDELRRMADEGDTGPQIHFSEVLQKGEGN
jgi:hypothetical protein